MASLLASTTWCPSESKDVANDAAIPARKTEPLVLPSSRRNMLPRKQYAWAMCLGVLIMAGSLTQTVSSTNSSTNKTTTDEPEGKKELMFTDILACILRGNVGCTEGEEQVAIFFEVVAGTFLMGIICLIVHCCRQRHKRKNAGKVRPMAAVTKEGRKTLKSMSSIKLQGNSKLEGAMASIFGSYDKDLSGAIDQGELADMMVELAGLMPGQVAPSRMGAKLIAAQVMTVLDADGNGELDKEEFTAWIVDKIHADEGERQQLALSNRHLYRFFEAMEVTLKMQLAGIGSFADNPYAEKADETRK